MSGAGDGRVIVRSSAVDAPTRSQDGLLEREWLESVTWSQPTLRHLRNAFVTAKHASCLEFFCLTAEKPVVLSWQSAL
jgi:hypothetical protein